MEKTLIYVDGASRGNPGSASIGVSICLESGEEVDKISEIIGVATNNEAEYRALIAGLKAVRDRRNPDIKVFADSELMVRQMKGEYKVKHPNLKPLFLEAKKLSGVFTSFEITHIYREDNKRADELANQALDRLT